MAVFARVAHNAGMSEPVASFTDEEYAFLRHVRFGELPAPVRPEERMESAETEVPRAGPTRSAASRSGT